MLALRLYSTAVYKSINVLLPLTLALTLTLNSNSNPTPNSNTKVPLRDTKRSAPHPLAITVSFVDEGVRIVGSLLPPRNRP